MEIFIILFMLVFAGIFVAIIRSAGRGPTLPRHGLPPMDNSDTIIQQQQHQAIHALHQQMHQAAHEQHMHAHHQAHQTAMDAAAHTPHVPSGCCDVGGHHHHH